MARALVFPSMITAEHAFVACVDPGFQHVSLLIFVASLVVEKPDLAVYRDARRQLRRASIRATAG